MKRIELVKYLNDKMKKKGSILRFEANNNLSIDVVLKDVFISKNSTLSKNEEFYTFIESEIVAKTNVVLDQISWNNVGSCFGIWIDGNTSYFEDCR